MRHADTGAFATWLREMMHSKWPWVLTTGALANLCGVRASTVRGWLAGRNSPPQTRLAAIAAAFSVPTAAVQGALGLDADPRGVLNDDVLAIEREEKRFRYRSDAAYRKRLRDGQRVPESRLSPAGLHQKWVASLPPEDRIAYLRFKRSANKAKRRARKLRLGEDFTTREFLAKAKAIRFVCVYCGAERASLNAKGQDLTADHVYPLALIDDPTRAHLASNSIDNVFPACFHCNCSKGPRDLLVWAASRGLTASLHPAVLTHYRTWPEGRSPKCQFSTQP